MGAAPEEEACGGRGQADLAPRAQNRSLHPPRVSCRSVLQTWKCDRLTQLWPPAPSFPLPSDSHVLDIGAQEQEVLVDLENRVIELNML